LDYIRESFQKEHGNLDLHEERAERALKSFSPAQLARREAVAGLRSDLVVHIKVESASSPAQLVDMDRRQAVVAVHGAPGEAIPDGARVDLVIRGAKDSRRVTIPCRIRGRASTRDAVQYTVELLAPGLVDELPAPLRRTVNTRNSFRAQVSALEPVRAEVWHPGSKRPVKANMVDVSATGAGFMVRAREAEIHAWGPVVGVRIWLPGDEESTDVYCRVQRVLTTDRYPVIGCEFEDKRNGTFKAAQSKISDYVMARQREGFAPTEIAKAG